MHEAALNLVVLYAADVAATRSFYEDLGLTFVSERHGNGPDHAASELAGGTVLEIFPIGDRTPAGALRLGLTLPGAAPTHESLPVGEHLRRDPDGRTVQITIALDHEE